MKLICSKKIILVLGLTAGLASCTSDDKEAVSEKNQKETLFTMLPAAETGIDFINTVENQKNFNIFKYRNFYNGGGVAIGDINNDGLADIYLSANMGGNKLYLNKGDFTFEDISEKAGVIGNKPWSTGVAMADINGDGLLDIYVCNAGNMEGNNHDNDLYINNGDLTFTEKAAEYNLAKTGFSTHASFFDYDKDGDLDAYILNNSNIPVSSLGYAEQRDVRAQDWEGVPDIFKGVGDMLLRNDDGKFVDVSEKAGIYGSLIGFGLGVMVSDINGDLWPDIYVSNDFYERDYLYINQKDGTFTEEIEDWTSHLSLSAMGIDMADINNDGYADIFITDMLPEGDERVKSVMEFEGYNVFKLKQSKDFYQQYIQNTLQLNNGNGSFSEVAYHSGVAATDWSWSALFGDYDQDGEQDIFISNGIPKRPNDLDYINFVSSDQIRGKMNNTKLMDQQALNKMPSGKIHNFIFKGTKNLSFQDRSVKWTVKDTLISGATAVGDLDNDGDLDLVTNNLNSPASLYINQTDDTSSYLKLRFKYSDGNPFGIGTKVFSYSDGNLQYNELYPVRGFQASSEPIIHFGYESADKVDSLRIVWPDGKYQILQGVPTNQSLTIEPKDTETFDYSSLMPKSRRLFNKVEGNLGIDFRHEEDSYTDFNRQKLIPYQLSDRGPATALGDLNDDGKTDIFFGGSKYYPSKIYVQNDAAFMEQSFPVIAEDSIKEDVTATIADFTGDGKNDVMVGSGGGDFYNQTPPLLDSYYIQQDGTFVNGQLPEIFENASVLAPNDFDGDSDLDVFVGNQAVTNDFGKLPNSYLLKNEGGRFSVVEDSNLQNLGMITDAVWHDFDGDGLDDLIVVGEWMAPVFFKNQNGNLSRTEVIEDKLNGLWQSIAPFDVDGDSDTDYLLGNWGSNSKFIASEKSPLKMYYGDFDGNGQTETITAIQKEETYYPLENLDGLASQMVFLKNKFNTYASFAGKSINEIFDENILEKANVLEAHELRSGFLRNDKGRFSFVPFQNELQVSPLMAFVSHDFNGDGKEDILAAGNYFGVKPYQGRFDSFPGALIKDENNVILGSRIGLNLSQKSVRHLNIIEHNDQTYLLVTVNNDSTQVYKVHSKQKISKSPADRQDLK